MGSAVPPTPAATAGGPPSPKAPAGGVVDEERAALRRSLERMGAETPERLIRDVIYQIERDYVEPFAARTVPTLRRALRRGEASARELVLDVIRSIEKHYTPAFAAKTVPTLRRALQLMDQ